MKAHPTFSADGNTWPVYRVTGNMVIFNFLPALKTCLMFYDRTQHPLEEIGGRADQQPKKFNIKRRTEMKRIVILLLFVVVFGLSTVAVDAQENSYADTIKMFREIPAVAKFFNNSYGYAVFPIIGKAGYVVGGSYGQGRVYHDGKVTGKSEIFEGSIGFQIGAEAFSEIIFFQDKRAYARFITGDFELDVTAQAVAVTAGVGAQAGSTGSSAGASAGPGSGIQTEARYVKGMATFVHAKGGLMAEATVGGQKFTFEHYRTSP
jgi:lipid-binding SYLF domain-containing protein